jgi:glycosyltransferase involved in cell wall biosynthesis
MLDHVLPKRRDKPRLAIVSTFDELCGIAGYTRFLVKQLSEHFEIDVFDLDQFLMRSTHRNVRKIADRMVKDFCARAKDFDFVNIQLEHGTLGTRRDDIWRRFAWIAKAAPALSVTFHTILPQDKFQFRGFVKKLGQMNFAGASEIIGSHRTNTMLTNRIYGLMRRLQYSKPINAIVHTRRDMRLMRYVNRLNSVLDHPLVFLMPEDIEKFGAEATRARFPLLERIPKNAKLVGVFGFLNDYKGFETAIRALQRLPRQYHLVIFGALHPNEIKQRQAINPYVKRLLDEANVRRTVLNDHENGSLSVSIDATTAHLLLDHPRDVSSRVHFMGSQTDEDFARGMRLCDHVVLPYLEVGQSSSGPISIALEMGARIIAARNYAFMQFARYHPNSIEMFEIGNHVELAERIMAAPAFPTGVRPRAYNSSTNIDLYVKANTRRAGELRKRLIASFSYAEKVPAE